MYMYCLRRFTLSTSNESIAALLCATFPSWPQTSRDNRYHLQPLRHLYVLAAVPRYVHSSFLALLCVTPFFHFSLFDSLHVYIEYLIEKMNEKARGSI
jgi:hypothetical protein